MPKAVLRSALSKLGLNYIYGLINFTVGVALGGLMVASILVARLM